MENKGKKKKYLLKDQGQGELPGMPKKTPLIKAAEQFLSTKGELEAVKEVFDNAKVDLVKEFRAAGKSRIVLDGHIIDYQHKESDSIKIVAPKEG